MFGLAMTRPGWDSYFLTIAVGVTGRADCTRRKVGAVIVKDNRIVSTGYNGAAAGRLGCLDGGCPRGQLSYEELAAYSDYNSGPGRCVSNHAEVNAILYANRTDRIDATLYSTEEPCFGCWKEIIGAKLYRVVWPTGSILVADKEL